MGLHDRIQKLGETSTCAGGASIEATYEIASAEHVGGDGVVVHAGSGGVDTGEQRTSTQAGIILCITRALAATAPEGEGNEKGRRRSLSLTRIELRRSPKNTGRLCCLYTLADTAT